MVEHAPAMTEETRRPVTVLTAGGTIAMQGDSAVPALDAAALTSGLPVDSRTLLLLPGAQLTLDHALSVARAAAREASEGRGVVVTTGTDTLEELAVLADVLNAGSNPVVFTGAIRPASAAGADGPANLRDAVAVAARAPGGTYVVFAGEIHAARHARKTDSTSPRAFSSPQAGPLGFVAEDRVSVSAPPARPPHLEPSRLEFTVPIVTTALGDDGASLRAVLAAGVDGLVLVALGAGHVPPRVLAALPRGVPVVACVRPERGAMLHATYGFEGAEGDLRAAGVIPAASVSPQAARMRLLAALGANADPATALSDLA
jgi:L-asparaginase